MKILSLPTSYMVRLFLIKMFKNGVLQFSPSVLSLMEVLLAPEIFSILSTHQILPLKTKVVSVQTGKWNKSLLSFSKVSTTLTFHQASRFLVTFSHLT